MAYIPNKLVIVGVLAVVAVFMTGMVSTLGVQEAYAEKPHNKNKCGNDNEGLNVVVCANIPVCAQVNVIAEDNQNNCANN